MNKRLSLLSLFTLIFLAHGQLEAQNLTVGEVFDYEVGDEFHLISRSHSSPPIIDRLTIIEKRYSKAKDTIFYSLANNGYTWRLWDLIALIDTQRIFYTNLSSPIFDAQLKDWEKEMNLIRDSMVVDTIKIPDSALCSTSKNAFHMKNSRFEFQRGYAKGLGFIYDYYFDTIGIVDGLGKNMFYYKKGNETCGAPDLKNSIPKIQPKLKIDVFPNPASETLYIAFDGNFNEPVNIELLSVNGEILMTTSLLTPTTQLSIENLAAGTYLVRCKTSQTAHTELIIKN